MKSGLIHLYTGDGKGKTTAAIGQGIRAAGRGLKVIMIQFFKAQVTGELIFAEKHKTDFKILRFASQKKFTNEMSEKEKEKLKEETNKTYNFIKELFKSKKTDIIILDEITSAINYGFIDIDEFIELLKTKPCNIEIILTGRNAPKKLIKTADLVTEMKKIRHPFDKGIKARKGIEL